MKKLISFLLLPLALSVSAQKIFKDKDQTLSEIKQKGYTINDFPDDHYFVYKRYDELGESKVYIFYEGAFIRKAVFSQNFLNTSNRFKAVYRDSPRGVDPTNMITTNTFYYGGTAKYECEDRFDTDRLYSFTVILLD